MLFSTPAQKNTPQSIEAGVLVPSSEGGGRKSAGMMGDRRPVDPLDGPSPIGFQAKVQEVAKQLHGPLP